MLHPIALVLFWGLLPGGFTASLPHPIATEAGRQTSGAATLDELGNRLHAALRAGSLSSLTPYIVDKQAYDRLRKQSAPQLRETLLLLTPENIMADFQREFNTVVQDGVTAEVNWAQTVPGGVRRQPQQQQEAHGLIPAILTVSDQNNQQLHISFEAVEIGNRYYFFQQVRLGDGAEQF